MNVANKLMVDAAASGSAEALTYLETDAPYVLANIKDEALIASIYSYRGLGEGGNT